MHTTLAQLAPATPVAQALQAALGAAPAVASSATPALSEAAITPASGDALGKDTPDAARGCTPIRPRDLLVQRDMFGGATQAPEADHTVTTKARKPRARKGSRVTPVAPCDHFLKVRIPGELHEQLMAKAGARGHPRELTRPILEAYQRHLYPARSQRKGASNGQPLSLRSQEVLIAALRGWCKWLTRDGHILANPASDLELPRLPRTLPRVLLSVDQVQQLMAQPDVEGLTGVRDRAMLELLYGSGMRRIVRGPVTIKP